MRRIFECTIERERMAAEHSNVLECTWSCTGWPSFTDITAGCGTDLLTGPGGEITSPAFPQPYGTNVHCAWTIRVQHFMNIVLNFVNFDLGHDGQTRSLRYLLHTHQLSLYDDIKTGVCLSVCLHC